MTVLIFKKLRRFDVRRKLLESKALLSSKIFHRYLNFLKHLAPKDRYKTRYKTTLLEFNQDTPNAHQMIALCLCNYMTPS